MSEETERKWNNIHSRKTVPGDPALVLTENTHLLPVTGSALDLACGTGGNSLWLAQHGLSVDAWDISAAGLEILAGHSKAKRIRPRQLDITESSLSANQWDLIVVAHYLDRSLAEAIVTALHPGGILCYQTFTLEKATAGGPGNPDYLLQQGELLTLFSSLRVLAYRDEGATGNVEAGFRNESYLVAQKPIASQE